MIILLLLAFISIWIIMGNHEREPNWRLALIQAMILWATFLVIGTEVLSIFNALNRLALSLMWSIPVIAGIIWTWIWLKQGRILRLPIVYRYDSWVGAILDGLVILILVITFIVAVVAPPNSNGALVFRMSRVAHWAQNESLAHYPTGIEIQNSYSPGAEEMILNFYILDGSDRFANLVAWIGFAGSVAAAASLAEVLGAKLNGQRMAAIFAASLPVAITQATSSMNDGILSFWVVATVLMLLYYTRKSAKPLNLVLTGLAAALAVVTKPTALIFLWPFALYLVVLLRKRLGMPKMLFWAVVALMIMGVINGGHFYRNHKTYGQFYRPVEMSIQSNDVRNWRVLASNVTRNAALHADLPFPRAEYWLLSNILRLHDDLNLDVADPRTTLGGTFYIPDLNTSEMFSSNPIHAAIIVLCFTAVVGMVVLGKEDAEILVYCGAVLFSVVLFCYLLKWQPTGGRLHLPFFVLLAPLVAVFLDKLEKFQLETAVAALLLVFAMPWLFQTRERPVIPDQVRTYPISVLDEARIPLYFATNPEDYEPYTAMAEVIKAHGYTRIGLDLTPASEEYLLWVLLDAPDDDLQIEWVSTSTASYRYLNQAFSPEAIICESCDRATLLAYAETYEWISFDRFDLFIKEE